MCLDYIFSVLCKILLFATLEFYLQRWITNSKWCTNCLGGHQNKWKKIKKTWLKVEQKMLHASLFFSHLGMCVVEVSGKIFYSNPKWVKSSCAGIYKEV